MTSKTIARGPALFTAVLASAALLGQSMLGQTISGQSKPAASSSAVGLELPVLMRQNVVAGKTPVGTKVQATLTVATLVNGVVVPQGAFFFGEVTESVAKSATNPSRLSVRMDSAQWKNKTQSKKGGSEKDGSAQDGSAPTALALAPKLYFTAWYYPAVPLAIGNQDLSSRQPDAGNNPGLRTGGGFPGARNPSSSPFPGPDTGKVPAETSDISEHRVLMKDVESARGSDGAVTLTSKRFNIKLDKTTTYVLAAGDLSAAN